MTWRLKATQSTAPTCARWPVRFELTEQTRESLDAYLRSNGRKPGQVLFPCRGGPTTRQYARLVERWVASVGLDPRKFATHSMRRTKATLIYRRTGNLRVVQPLLGHTRIDYVPCGTMSRRAVMCVLYRYEWLVRRDIGVIVVGLTQPDLTADTSVSAPNPVLVALNAQFAEISQRQAALRDPTVKRRCMPSFDVDDAR
jgi:hypothetical protein